MSKTKKALIIIPVALAVVAVSAFAYLYTHGLSGMMPKVEIKDSTIKVACVGDSVTYGHGIKNWNKNTYPAVLGSLLGDKYSVVNYGNSGTTVQNDADQPYTATKQYSLSLESKPDIVIFMLGSNDSKPKNWKDGETFKAAYIELLDKYIETGAKVYIATSPEAYYAKEGNDLTSFEIAPKVVDEIAAIQKEVAKEKGIEVIDIHALTENSVDYFLSDCVHPNIEGAKAIAQTVATVIK